MIRRADLDNALERDFQAEVLRLARMAGWRCYHTHDSRRSAPGFPDVVFVKNKRVIFAELKTERGKPTVAQMEWIQALDNCETVATVWRPSDLEQIEYELTKRRW